MNNSKVLKSVTEDEIRERIAAIEKERDLFIRQANERVAAYNGAVEALNGLLKDNKEEETSASRV